MIAAISAAMVAAGCTSGNDVRAVTLPPSSAATVSASATAGTPTSSPPAPAPAVPADVPGTGRNLLRAGEKPPVMPLAATRHTSGGAVAFAVFFAQTIDWGYATSDPAYMNHYFQPTCLECVNLRNGLNTARKKSAYYRGARVTIKRANLGAVGGPDGAERSVVVDASVTSFDVVDKNGISLAAGPPLSQVRQEFWLSWRAGGWTTVDLRSS